MPPKRKAAKKKEEEEEEEQESGLNLKGLEGGLKEGEEEDDSEDELNDGQLSDLDEGEFAAEDEDGEEAEEDDDDDDNDDSHEDNDDDDDDDEGEAGESEDDEEDFDNGEDEEEEEEEEEEEPAQRPTHDLWEDEEVSIQKSSKVIRPSGNRSQPSATGTDKANTVAQHEKGKRVASGNKFSKRGILVSQGPLEGTIVPESDSEEDGPVMRNPVGEIPMEWYKDEKHIGYDLQGKRIIRKPRKDTLDAHLAKADDPQSWRNVYDEVNDEELRLTDEELRLLRRLRAGMFDPGYDPYADYPDPIDDPEHKIHPLSSRPEPKSRFVPSKHEAKQVVRYVRMIRAGKVLRPQKATEGPELYNFDLWEKDMDVKWRGAVPIAAPKPKLPGHAESYNPPQEYLLTEEEREELLKKDIADRPMNFIPTKYDALRKVPLYGRILHERFERCLDLYLCPRAVKKRMNVDPESLLPKLPKPQDLRPFPTTLSIQYLGHTDRVNSITVQPSGVLLASGSQDGTVRVWEVSTGRCLRTWNVKKPVTCVAWNPNPELSIIAASVGSDVMIFDPLLGDGEETAVSELMQRGRESANESSKASDAKKDLVTWVDADATNVEDAGLLVTIKHMKPIKQIAWHQKGDYIVTLSPTANSKAILIHQLSRRQSQNPFAKSKADAIKVMFHPSKPFLFVASRKHVKVYNLLKQSLAKKLIGGFKYMSSFDIHPGGDNLVCTAVDRRISWFDMDLSTKPYKTLRYDNTGLSSVSFHKRYPLFATGGIDGNVYVFHGMVYSDLLQNPLIVPVKKLHAHKSDGTEGATDVLFHPTQPWIFTCGMDAKIHLFTEL